MNTGERLSKPTMPKSSRHVDEFPPEPLALVRRHDPDIVDNPIKAPGVHKEPS